MPVSLPIFPLGTVLVPGLLLPLHIFEERYRVLIQALLALPDGAVRQFGVVAIRMGSEAGEDAPDIYAVGCTAELREVTPFSDGRFDIVTVGERRFRILDVEADSGTPYLTASVEFLDEVDGGTAEELAVARSNVVAQFADYRSRLGTEPTEIPSDPRVTSYLVAAAVVLERAERQRLLELPTVLSRLQAEIELLSRERALVTAFQALPPTEPLDDRPGLN